MLAAGTNSSAQAISSAKPALKAAEPAANAATPPTSGRAQQAAQAPPAPKITFQFFMVLVPGTG